MDIVNFFEKVEGTWFSQRTTHFPLGQPSQTGQTTLHITRLMPDDARVIALCQPSAIAPTDVVFAIHIQQEPQASVYGPKKTQPQRQTVLLGTKATNAGITGQFFSQTEQEPISTGQYTLEDEVLTLTIQTDELQSEERLWFMNPNLRMRTSVLERADGLQMASFCSEVRRLAPAKP